MLRDESREWPSSLLNDEQISKKVRVKHLPLFVAMALTDVKVLVQLVPSLFFGSWTPTVQAAWIWPCVRSGYSTEVCQDAWR